MTREEMIQALQNRCEFPSYVYPFDIAAQLKADGEMIARLTRECDAAMSKMIVEVYDRHMAEIGDDISVSLAVELVDAQASRDAALARIAELETLIPLDQGGCDDRQLLPTLADYNFREATLRRRFERIAELEAALKPFADYAEKRGPDLHMGRAEIGEFYHDALRVSISSDDLRRAREALSHA